MRRVRALNDGSVGTSGYVLYWMTAARRPHHNHALDRAIELAEQRQLPLVVLEALRLDYPWAAARHHTFILRGMTDNRAAFANSPVLHHAYVETQRGSGKGLLQAWARGAACVVADDHPGFFWPRMLAAAARQVRCRMEAVDSNGLLPLDFAERAYTTAASFRRFLHKQLPALLRFDFPDPRPLSGLQLPALKMPQHIANRWPQAPRLLLAADAAEIGTLPIDQSVAPVAIRGGHVAGTAALDRFVARHLDAYHVDRNHPQRGGTSGLSPYLHYGHVGAHQAFAAIAAAEHWSPSWIADRPTGSRAGWWGMSEAAEAVIDQLVTWRELAFNGSRFIERPEEFESLPDWAQQTLQMHAADPRPHVYSTEQFERGHTHDPLWNAAQNELRETGAIHNYLRMLWGKKILHWSASPQEALATMLHLNNKYAVDGRDPNSTAGIAWVLGRYDRAWGPERPIFGKIRYMTSASTQRKTNVRRYIERFAA